MCAGQRHMERAFEDLMSRFSAVKISLKRYQKRAAGIKNTNSASHQQYQTTVCQFARIIPRDDVSGHGRLDCR